MPQIFPIEPATPTNYRFDRFDRQDRATFLADLEAGKLGTSWRPFVLVFYGTPAADLDAAITAIEPLRRGFELDYPADPRAALAFARRLGAEDPIKLIHLLSLVADAADRPAEVCALLQGVPYV